MVKIYQKNDEQWWQMTKTGEKMVRFVQKIRQNDENWREMMKIGETNDETTVKMAKLVENWGKNDEKMTKDHWNWLKRTINDWKLKNQFKKNFEKQLKLWKNEWKSPENLPQHLQFTKEFQLRICQSKKPQIWHFSSYIFFSSP